MYVRVQTEALEDLADGDLIRRFKGGDDEALEVLLRRHADDLYRFCCHLVPNRQDAEDICQESLARAIDRVDSLQSDSAFRGWLFRIARNLSVDSFRSRRRTCPLPDEEVSPTSFHVDGPQDHVETGEEYQTVAQALANLAQSHQRVLLLREVEGLSYADIAHRLNVSQSAVETLLFRARRRLREEYVKRGSTAPGMAGLVGLRGLAGRLLAPLLGGGHIAAKLAITAAVVGGAVLTAPHLQRTSQSAVVSPPMPGHARSPLPAPPSVSDHAPGQRAPANRAETASRASVSRSTRRQQTSAQAAGGRVMTIQRRGPRASTQRQTFTPSHAAALSRGTLVRRSAAQASTGQASIGARGAPPSLAISPPSVRTKAGDAPHTSPSPALSRRFTALQRPLTRSLGAGQTQRSRAMRRAGAGNPSGAPSQSPVRTSPGSAHGRANRPHRQGTAVAQTSGLPAHSSASAARPGPSHGSGSPASAPGASASGTGAAGPKSRPAPAPGGSAPNQSASARGQGQGANPNTSSTGTQGGSAQPHGAPPSHSARKHG